MTPTDVAASRGWSRGRVLVLLGALFLFYVFPLGFWPELPGANETAHMYLGMALYDRAEPFVDLEVRDYFFSHDCTFDGEHYRSNKQPGLGLWLVPGVALVDLLSRGPPEMVHVHYFARVLMITIPLLLFLWLLGRTLEGLVRPSIAWGIVIAYALGSNASVYATRLFSHDVTAIALGTAFILLWRGPRFRWLAGLLCGLAVLCESQTAGVAIVMTVLAAFDRERVFRPKALVSFAVGAAVMAAVLFAYNAAAHGGAVAGGYGLEFAKFSVQKSIFGFYWPQPHKFAKLLFSPLIGVFFHAPWLVLVGPATWWCLKRARGERFLLLGAAIASIVHLTLVCSHTYWLGGATVGPRYITPVVPLLLIVIAAGFGTVEFRRPAVWIGTACALVVAGIAWHVSLILTTTDINTWGDQWALNPVSGFAMPLLERGITTLTVGRVLFGMSATTSGVLLVALALAPIGIYFAFALRGAAPRAPLLGGAVGGLALFGVLTQVGASESFLTRTHHPRLFAYMSEQYLRRFGGIQFKWRPSAGAPRRVAYGRMPRDPRFEELLDDAAPMEEIARNLNFVRQVLWRPDESLLVSDVMKNVVYRITPDGELAVWRANAGCAHWSIADIRFPGVNDIVRHPITGDLILAEHGRRRLVVHTPDGKDVVLADKFGGNRLNMPNSVAVRSDGAVYFTDPTVAFPPLRNDKPIPGFERELPFAGIFRVKGGQVDLLESRVSAPYDLAFSPDESILYMIELTERQFVLAFPVLPDGKLAPPRTFAQTRNEKTPRNEGIAVDERGNVWVAGGDGVRIFDRTGKLLGTIHRDRPMNGVDFGGPDGKTLYLTDGFSVYRMRVRVAGALHR